MTARSLVVVGAFVLVALRAGAADTVVTLEGWDKQPVGAMGLPMGGSSCHCYSACS